MTQELVQEIANQPIPNELLVDDDITLVRFRPEDAESIYNLVDQNRDFLAQTHDWAAIFTPEMAQGGVANMAAEGDNGTTAAYKMLYQGELVGVINLSDRIDSSAEMAYWMAESAQGKGIATRSANRLLSFGFNEWGLTNVTLQIEKSNERSQRLAQKMGAHLVGEVAEQPSSDLWKISKHEQ
jgi:ribosomal-protein-serine acetyltransferase